MEKLKKNKGITLIALIVTIIVLIILASISINMVLGGNGIITKTKEIKIKNNVEQIKEEIRDAWNAVQIDGIPKKWNNEAKRSALESDLKSKDNTATATLNGSDIEIVYKGYETTINIDNGSIAELAKVDDIPDDTGTINWSQIMKTAQKHPDQRNSNDIGLDAEGNVVNLDLWVYVVMDNHICMGLGQGCDNDQPIYFPFQENWETSNIYNSNLDISRIVCPEYIKIYGKNEYYPVNEFGGSAFWNAVRNKRNYFT